MINRMSILVNRGISLKKAFSLYSGDYFFKCFITFILLYENIYTFFYHFFPPFFGSFCFFPSYLSKNVSGSFQFGFASFSTVCSHSSTESTTLFSSYFSCIFNFTSQFGLVKIWKIFVSDPPLLSLGL